MAEAGNAEERGTDGIPGLMKEWHRPPLIGIFAFLAVLLTLPVAHSWSAFTREIIPAAASGPANFLLGLCGLGLLIYAIRDGQQETKGTLLGFISGLMLWTGWAAYMFAYNHMALGRPMMDITPEQSRPLSLLFMQGSFGICVATLLYFVLDKNTKCNAFRWLQRKLHLSFGRADSGQDRNFAKITFMETIYVTWFCYGFTLFLGDDRFLGYKHPATYVIVAAIGIWSLYLIWKLSKFTRIMAAIRYAIPTKALFWIVFGEYGPRLGWYKEFWLHPTEYTSEIIGVLAVTIILLILPVYMPQRKQKVRTRPKV